MKKNNSGKQNNIIPILLIALVAIFLASSEADFGIKEKFNSVLEEINLDLPEFDLPEISMPEELFSEKYFSEWDSPEISFENFKISNLDLNDIFSINTDEASDQVITTTDTSSEMVVHFIDVGQGDCQLIQIPSSDGTVFNLLIDSGESSQSETVISYIDSLGITTLDAILVTHPHADHMGCMGDILLEYDVDTFYMPNIPESQTPTTVAYEKILDALIEKDMKMTTIGTGDVIPSTDECVIQVVSPISDKEYDNMNDYSVVVKITYGETSFIFMGDAEYENIEDALDSGIDLDSDVLKVGHHGSSNGTTAELLEAVTPTLGIISCGEDNSYGHPHEETIDLLDEYNVEYLITYEEGTIIYKTDGETVLRVS